MTYYKDMLCNEKDCAGRSKCGHQALGAKSTENFALHAGGNGDIGVERRTARSVNRSCSAQ